MISYFILLIYFYFVLINNIVLATLQNLYENKTYAHAHSQSTHTRKLTLTQTYVCAILLITNFVFVSSLVNYYFWYKRTYFIIGRIEKPAKQGLYIGMYDSLG